MPCFRLVEVINKCNGLYFTRGQTDLMVLPGLKLSESHSKKKTKKLTELRERTQCSSKPVTCTSTANLSAISELRRKKKKRVYFRTKIQLKGFPASFGC